MQSKTPYTAYPPDSYGHIAWSADENAIWRDLRIRQQKASSARLAMNTPKA